MIPFPDKKYNIIYADPPWEYENKILSPPQYARIAGSPGFATTATPLAHANEAPQEQRPAKQRTRTPLDRRTLL